MVAALRGDRASNDAHYLRALDHAERGRDVVQTIRIRSNRGSHFLEEGDYPAALAEIEVALRLADMTGFELWRGMALANRGEVVARLGSLEEAIADLTQARMVFRRIGSRLEAYPLAHLGDVYAARGDRSLARSCYEQALGLLDEEDQQGLVPTLSGLARLLAGDDNDAARRLAKRATEIDSVIGRARALVALGWVEHAAGDPEAAMALAVEAAAVGRARRDSPGLAASLVFQCKRFSRSNLCVSRSVEADIQRARGADSHQRQPLARRLAIAAQTDAAGSAVPDTPAQLAVDHQHALAGGVEDGRQPVAAFGDVVE
jgi:tetratricopeptide (TPR) repeat protein